MTYSLTDMSSLGIIESEHELKDANLFTAIIPRSDSSVQFILDIFGTIRTITLKGKYVGTDVAAVTSFVQDLMDLATGVQTSRTFHSDIENRDLTVYIQNVEYTYEAGSPLMVTYTINLMEGRANT